MAGFFVSKMCNEGDSGNKTDKKDTEDETPKPVTKGKDPVVIYGEDEKSNSI